MELQPNMYVRTKVGIYKINHFINNSYTQKFTYIDNQGVSNILDEEEIIKVSYNIIDLIQVGDFVDGKQVVNAIHCKDGFNRIELFGGKAIMNKTPIKSILTKEQFESMSYKVGE